MTISSPEASIELGEKITVWVGVITVGGGGRWGKTIFSLFPVPEPKSADALWIFNP